jgi:hypothetical protein
MVSLRDLGAVDLAQVLGDLAGREPFGVEGEDRLVEAVQAPLVLGHDHRSEVTGAVARHLDGDRSDVGVDRLSRRAIARVARAASRRIVGLIAQVIGHLDVESRLEHRLGDPG